MGAGSGRVSSSACAETLRQPIDTGADVDAVEGRGRCTARRHAYGFLPAARACGVTASRLEVKG